MKQIAGTTCRPGLMNYLLHSMSRSRITLLSGTLVAVMFFQPAYSESIMSLSPCSNNPNCVSSQATDKDHFIEPFTFNDTPQQAWQRLTAALLAEKRLTITSEEGNHLHAEARSLIFRFVDDVEFLLSREHGRIDCRSASRTGYSDFGVNRKRLEQIRARFNQQ